MKVYLSIAFEYQKTTMEAIRLELEKRGHTCTYEPEDGCDFTVMGDAGARRHTALAVSVNHGMGTKDKFWVKSDKNLEKNELETKVPHFVPSEFFKTRLEKLGRKAVVTGVPRLDAAFKLNKFDKPTVFYATTCHVELCSLFYIGKHIYNLNEFGYDVLVSPHKMMREQILCVNDMFPNVCEEDAAYYVARSDIVIGDYATTVLDGIIFNKPTIVFRMGDYELSKHYNPENIEVMFSDCMYVAESIHDVYNYVYKINKGIDPLKTKREEASKILCEYQGCAAKKFCDELEKLCKQ